jgi:SAM-dependent methyltransferase
VSILRPIARLLLEEHKRKPITGDVLTIGRQSVDFPYSEAVDMLSESKVAIRPVFYFEIDTETVGYQDRGHPTDTAFFSMFSGGKLSSLDVSPYEGAAIIHDMNKELPSEHYGCADFVFDGSCLDNIFDPACALRSMSHLLRPGGRMFLFNHSTLIQSAYLAFSPEWFWDFFEFNGYQDIQVFTGSFKSVGKAWDVSPWMPGWPYPKQDFITVAIAEKANDVEYVAPIQAHYRKMHSA